MCVHPVFDKKLRKYYYLLVQVLPLTTWDLLSKSHILDVLDFAFAKWRYYLSSLS